MRRIAQLTVGFIVLAGVVIVGVGSAAALTRSPASASYRVHLVSDGQGHTWTGTESIAFTNTSNRPIRVVWIHLWSNGVKGCGVHAITVSHMTGGVAGSPILKCTALPVRFAHPLGAHRRTTLSMRVQIHLFHRSDRFGFNGGVSLLGTALPTLAVRDDHGWNLNPFVDIGESFYSLVSDYRVTLDTPKALRTPTTGTLVSTSHEGARTRRTYVASHVRDFEWAAARFRELTGHADGTKVRISYLPATVTLAEAKETRKIAVEAMKTFSGDFGAYPYSELDVVVTPSRTFGGMEYPTIVFTAARRGAITHEIAHQWFYGMVGDDQFRDPWLDESFATWATSLPRVGSKTCPSYTWDNPRVRLDSSMAYFRRVPEAYGDVYYGGACMLSQLSDRFGEQRFVRILRNYVADHRYGVVRSGDFRHAIARAARSQLPGFDLTAFWRRWRIGPPR